MRLRIASGVGAILRVRPTLVGAILCHRPTLVGAILCDRPYEADAGVRGRHVPWGRHTGLPLHPLAAPSSEKTYGSDMSPALNVPLVGEYPI